MIPPLIVFVPCLMGSILYKGDFQIWPLTDNSEAASVAWETIKKHWNEGSWGFDDIVNQFKDGGWQSIELLPDAYLNDLLDPSLKANGSIVRTILSYPLYEPIEDFIFKLGFKDNYLAAGYDWRRDIRDTTAEIAARIEEFYLSKWTDPKEPPKLILLSHSMGGIVVRNYLNSPQFFDSASRRNVIASISIGSAADGSMQAFDAFLGSGTETFISSEQIRKIFLSDVFRSGVQMLPSPDRPVWFLDEADGKIRRIDLLDELNADDQFINHFLPANLTLDFTTINRIKDGLNFTQYLAANPVAPKVKGGDEIEYIEILGSIPDASKSYAVFNRMYNNLTVYENHLAGDGTIPFIVKHSLSDAVQVKYVSDNHYGIVTNEQTFVLIRNVLKRHMTTSQLEVMAEHKCEYPNYSATVSLVKSFFGKDKDPKTQSVDAVYEMNFYKDCVYDSSLNQPADNHELIDFIEVEKVGFVDYRSQVVEYYGSFKMDRLRQFTIKDQKSSQYNSVLGNIVFCNVTIHFEDQHTVNIPKCNYSGIYSKRNGLMLM